MTTGSGGPGSRHVDPQHIDVAAYALDVLDADEVEPFEQHLAGCARCQSELREFTALRGFLDRLTPPAGRPPRQPPARFPAGP